MCAFLLDKPDCGVFRNSVATSGRDGVNRQDGDWVLLSLASWGPGLSQGPAVEHAPSCCAWCLPVCSWAWGACNRRKELSSGRKPECRAGFLWSPKKRAPQPRWSEGRMASWEWAPGSGLPCRCGKCHSRPGSHAPVGGSQMRASESQNQKGLWVSSAALGGFFLSSFLTILAQF